MQHGTHGSSEVEEPRFQSSQFCRVLFDAAGSREFGDPFWGPVGSASAAVRLRGGFGRRRKAGTNRFRFTGRLVGKKLQIGSYKLVARATAGHTVAAKSAKSASSAEHSLLRVSLLVCNASADLEVGPKMVA